MTHVAKLIALIALLIGVYSNYNNIENYLHFSPIKVNHQQLKMRRQVLSAVLSVEKSEGVGARVRRSIGTSKLRNLDPFLMLDEFFVKKPAGFPDHPHAFFETVTYMLDGKFEHEDFMGNHGVLDSGDLQWMTAGKGIVHAEMPHPDSDLSHGLQLWVNLPKSKKRIDPGYQELKGSDVPVAKPTDGVDVKVIAGDAFGVNAKVLTKTPIFYLDIRMKPHQTIQHAVPVNWTCFAYTLSGNVKFTSEDTHNKIYEAHNAIVFSKAENQTHVEIATGDHECHLVLLGAEPIGEPIVQYGPFVGNTEDDIQQVIADYQSARNGFERVRHWQSKIGKRLR